jgi:hypothetical protein
MIRQLVGKSLGAGVIAAGASAPSTSSCKAAQNAPGPALKGGKVTRCQHLREASRIYPLLPKLQTWVLLDIDIMKLHISCIWGI